MKSVIMKYINTIHGYRVAVKNLHWSAKNMSEHKLCDEISSLLDENEDMIAEICQGIHGKININELKPIKYKISTTQTMLSDLLKVSEKFYNQIKGKQYIGLRSVMENFMGEINKYQYLIKFCIKEDIKRSFYHSLNESRRMDNIITNVISKYLN